MERKDEKKRTIIGIDPDNNESGIAILVLPQKYISVGKANFVKLTEMLRNARTTLGNVEVIVEGGWLNSSNWHALGRRMSISMAAEIGRRTGMNHQTGILIEQFCKSFGLDCKVVKPLKKCWHGKDGKITQNEAEYFMGKLSRMNQDVRDALLLAWVYAGLNVKVMPKQSGKVTKAKKC